MERFRVLRRHWGDRTIKGQTLRHRYRRGSIRLLDPDAAAPLVRRGVLEPVVRSTATTAGPD